jgi:hypothetical protein
MQMTEERPSEATPPAPAQPAVAWAPAPAVTQPTGERTTLSLAAGILLVILGVLGVLASLAALTIGRQLIRQFDLSTIPGLERLNDPGAFVDSVLTFGAIFLLVCSTLYVVGGVGVIRSKSWGRVVGIVIAILAGLLWLGSFASIGRAPRDDTTFALVLLVLHAYIAIALLFFWRRKTAAT